MLRAEAQGLLCLFRHGATSAARSALWVPAPAPWATNLSFPSDPASRRGENSGAEKSSHSAACRANHAESSSQLVKSACMCSASLTRGCLPSSEDTCLSALKSSKHVPKTQSEILHSLSLFALFSSEKFRWVLVSKTGSYEVTLSALYFWISKVEELNS